MIPQFIKGGIGDFLQSVESAKEATVIDIYSHFSKPEDFFTPLDVVINRFEYFSSISDLNQCLVLGQDLPRKFYPVLPEFTPLVKKPGNKIIGVHIEGSEFSNKVWQSRNCPSKNMSREFMVSLFKDLYKKNNDYFLYLFCNPSKLNEVGQLAAEFWPGEFYVIAFDKIWDSLSCVRHCNFVIGMDSCIKTMANILKIPSLALVGNYSDSFRDENFLKPYVSDGIMEVILFDNINAVNTLDVVNYIKI